MLTETAFSNETIKRVNNINHYSVEQFCQDLKDYCDAFVRGTLVMVVKEHRKSSMSYRVGIYDISHEGIKTKVHSFPNMLKACNFRISSKDPDSVNIKGAGQSVYCVIHERITSLCRKSLVCDAESIAKMVNANPVTL